MIRSHTDRTVWDNTGSFDVLVGRFGIEVLGTMDDDEVMVVPSNGYAYILADAAYVARSTLDINGELFMR